MLNGSICLLLRWGAIDAEAYPEASKNVLQILWSVSISGHPGLESQWAKARASSLEALAQYEVNFQDGCNLCINLVPVLMTGLC